MGVTGLARGGMAGLLLRWASRLRFPYLFAFTAALFVINLFVPDVIPMADELVMGLIALLFGSWRKRTDEEESNTSPGTPDR
jgi:hypothetical protein